MPELNMDRIIDLLEKSGHKDPLIFEENPDETKADKGLFITLYNVDINFSDSEINFFTFGEPRLIITTSPYLEIGFDQFISIQILDDSGQFSLSIYRAGRLNLLDGDEKEMASKHVAFFKKYFPNGNDDESTDTFMMIDLQSREQAKDVIREYVSSVLFRDYLVYLIKDHILYNKPVNYTDEELFNLFLSFSFLKQPGCICSEEQCGKSHVNLPRSISTGSEN